MTKKQEERNELREELKLKIDQLKDKTARLKGGFSPILRKDVMPIDKELNRIDRIIRMRKIELKEDFPKDPKFAFELNTEWREIRRSFAEEELLDMENHYKMLLEQKEAVNNDIPALQARINEIENRLDLPVTDFKKDLSYIG